MADPVETADSKKIQPVSEQENTGSHDDSSTKPGTVQSHTEVITVKAYGPLPIDSDWHKRAENWFSSREKKERRKEMRSITRALKQPCRYCHTPDFKDFTDHKLISQQMMAISAEYQVDCADCHSGKNEMTPMGLVAQKMWALAHEKKVECNHCHSPGQGFLNLTPTGLDFKNSGH